MQLKDYLFQTIFCMVGYILISSSAFRVILPQWSPNLTNTAVQNLILNFEKKIKIISWWEVPTTPSIGNVLLWHFVLDDLVTSWTLLTHCFKQCSPGNLNLKAFRGCITCVIISCLKVTSWETAVERKAQFLFKAKKAHLF